MNSIRPLLTVFQVVVVVDMVWCGVDCGKVVGGFNDGDEVDGGYSVGGKFVDGSYSGGDVSGLGKKM